MPKKISILLVCGSEASAGFMAANVRKAAREKNLELDIIARSEAEIEVDFILLGPHLNYLEDDIKERVEELLLNVGVYVMERGYYAALDGNAALDDLEAHMRQRQSGFYPQHA